jgi:hypothetical protein
MGGDQVEGLGPGGHRGRIGAVGRTRRRRLGTFYTAEPAGSDREAAGTLWPGRTWCGRASARGTCQPGGA